MDETKKETIWKITDIEEILKTRVSEHRVQTMLDGVDQRLTKSARILDATLKDQVYMFNNELTHKLDKLRVFAEEQHQDLKVKV